MAETTEASYLSIGEVLGLLLEEFPDVTISKIRFLESQGLISPERTASGYRKFYDADVDLLRVILTEQRQNFLPLRVIKDRLDSGEIDPTGEHLRPNGEAETATESAESTEPTQPADVPERAVAAHPSSRARTTDEPSGPAERGPDGDGAATASADAAQLLPGVLLDRAELCSMVGMTDGELAQLESFGIIAPSDAGGAELYDDDAVCIARTACEFLRAGVDARHLRTFRTAAEREALLYEQLVTPRFRQRNPEARAAALAQLRRLDELGAELRSALTRQALRQHFE